MLKKLLEQTNSRIEKTENVEELKSLNAQKEELTLAIGKEADILKEVETLKEQKEALEKDLLQALRNSVVKEQPRDTDEDVIKSDQDIYQEWRKSL